MQKWQDDIFICQMQTTDKKDLPLRARYYQSLMDIESTQRGTKYKALKQNVVIFICLQDPFDMAADDRRGMVRGSRERQTRRTFGWYR